MLERAVELETPDGRMPVFITHPEEGPHPTVILFMDALGIREELRDMARRIGTVGYYVMLANLFYRDGGPSFDPALLPTQGPDPEMMRINMATTHAMVLADTLAMLRFAADDPAARDPVGTIGYCMGGRHAYAAAGRFPDRVAAMASLHAGFQVTDRPEFRASPDPATSRPSATSASPTTIRSRRPSTKKSSPRNADVGASPTASRFFPAQSTASPSPSASATTKPSAERAWERIFALFDRRLRCINNSAAIPRCTAFAGNVSV